MTFIVNHMTDMKNAIFDAPTLGEQERKVAEEVENLNEKLRSMLHEPRRWGGSLRRVSMARAILGSNSIEGFNAPLDDGVAVAVGEDPIDPDEETRLALKGYRDAMTYVLQLATDTGFAYNEGLIKSLHFMMTSYDLKNRPGLWRVGPVYVRNEETQEIVYEGADIDRVPDLIREIVHSLNEPSDVVPMVRAAMAHLNLAMVHPFRDGNGRMARCLQTLVLAREGTLVPVFCSIEEYLGRNTQAYYDVLAAVGGGHWQPDRDATPWVRFILTAHLRQARTLLRRVRETERLWADLEAITKKRALAERMIPALYDAAYGFRVRRATYQASDPDELTDQTATRDLRQLVEEGLLVPKGEKRGRHYLGSPALRAVRRAIIDARDPKDLSDPFAPQSDQIPRSGQKAAPQATVAAS